MNMERIQDVIGEVQEEYIMDAEFRVVKKPSAWKYWAAAAACLVLGVVIGAFAATTVMADEYSQTEAEYTQAEVDALLAQAEAESGGFIKVEYISAERQEALEEFSANASEALIAVGFEYPYPVNENGQTYGLTVSFGDGTTVMPDLVEVPLQGYDEYTPGYVYAEVYKEYQEADLMDSLAMTVIRDADGNVVGCGLPAYASDGVTIIGMF